MSVDPEVIRAEIHPEIGDLLQSNVRTVIDRWSQRAIEEQPHAKRVHHSVLLNKLVDFLETLGRSLAESEKLDNCQRCVFASIHGEQRWESGWSLPELVGDYQILRLVILDFLKEILDRPLGYREVLAIGLALDEAIAASVAMYVKHRDEHIQQLQEKRAEEQEQIQRQLREQTEAFREADRRKNEYLAVLAHELRNPLAPIRNAIEIMKLKATPDTELQWAQEIVERQVHQMGRMVDDLLDVSRISLGKVKLEKAPLELSSIVMRAVEIARPLIDAKKHQFTLTLAPEPMWLEGDMARMTQVLVNLLMNAAKYTDAGGQIWLNCDRDGQEVVLRVRDTGIGIPAELLARVFEPFTQEESSIDRAHGGLGIGLTLARNLIDLHGGRIQAFSSGRGKGSEFVVLLPLIERPPPTVTGEADALERRHVPGLRIVVVDDQVDAAQSLGLLLKLRGHNVRTTSNGPEALQLSQEFRPEIVLLDIGLPHMDGLEVARRLRQISQLKDVLLVALTGYGQDDDRRRSKEAGFDAHLVKPVNLDELDNLLVPRGTTHPNTSVPLEEAN